MDAALFINNKDVTATGGRMFERRDPAVRAPSAAAQGGGRAGAQDEAQIPFGGMKASGYGKFGGRAAINEFTELRWITIETEQHRYPF
jgi:hypothetical protein